MSFELISRSADNKLILEGYTKYNDTVYSQCGNVLILLTLEFYVKSILMISHINLVNLRFEKLHKLSENDNFELPKLPKLPFLKF